MLIGCDPELIVIKNNSFVEACQFFQSDGGWGCDGNSAIAEVRPGCDESPLILTAKIRHLMARVRKDLPDLDYLAGAYKHGHAIGGHIHISDKTFLPTRRLVENLDRYLTDCLSDLIDPVAERAKRRDRYGKKGEWEGKSSCHIEYRTPVSWLVNPWVTLANLCVAKAVAFLTLSGKKADNKDFPFYAEDKLKMLLALLNKGIPDDCKAGIKLIPKILENPPGWRMPISEQWEV